MKVERVSDDASRITFDGPRLDDFIKPGESTDLGNGITFIRRIYTGGHQVL